MSEPFDPLTSNPTFYRSSLPGSKPPAQLQTNNDPISPRTQSMTKAEQDRSELFNPLNPNPTFYRSSLTGSKPSANFEANNDPIQSGSKVPDAGALKRQAMQKELEETQGIMKDNMLKISERGEMLDHLETIAGELGLVSQSFRRSATDVRKRMWWKNAKWWIILGVVVALLIGGSVFGAIKHKEIVEVMHPAPTQPILANSTMLAVTNPPITALDTPIRESALLDPLEM